MSGLSPSCPGFPLTPIDQTSSPSLAVTETPGEMYICDVDFSETNEVDFLVVSETSSRYTPIPTPLMFANPRPSLSHQKWQRENQTLRCRVEKSNFPGFLWFEWKALASWDCSLIMRIKSGIICIVNCPDGKIITIKLLLSLHERPKWL